MGSGWPQRAQLRSFGELATPQSGFAQIKGGASSSWLASPVVKRKPQSMHDTAPSLRGDWHAGHLVGVAAAAGAAAGAGRGAADAGFAGSFMSGLDGGRAPAAAAPARFGT